MVRRILPLVQPIGHAARSRRVGPTAHRSVFKIDVGHLLLKLWASGGGTERGTGREGHSLRAAKKRRHLHAVVNPKPYYKGLIK